MIDKKFLIQNQEAFETSCKKRNIASNYNEFLELYNETKKIIHMQEEKRAEQKKEIGASENAKKLKEELVSLNTLRSSLEEKLNIFLLNMPNILHSDVHAGVDEKENKVVQEANIIEKNSIPHDNIIESWIMQNESANISGSRFVIFKEALSRLKNALVEFMLEHNRNLGYKEYSIPYLVNESALYGTGQLPKFAQDAFCTTENKWLISTGEIGLVNMFQNYVFEEKDLPKLCVTYSPCFRSEAGSAGRDTKGILRLHQFHKVELVAICLPYEADKIHEKNILTAQNILNLLKLPFQTLLMCGGDTGFTATKQYDIEVWMPGSNRFVEIASSSQCGTFQAIRANIRYKDSDGKMQFAHTLNGSSLPIERLIAAIVENYYEADGSVTIPSVLVPYTKFSKILANGDVE